MFLQNVAIWFPKIFWTIRWVVGTFPPSEILRGKRTKILVKHIATFSKRRYMFPKTLLYVSQKFFGLYVGCSLITIATFSKNVAINKNYATKIVLFATF